MSFLPKIDFTQHFKYDIITSSMPGNFAKEDLRVIKTQKSFQKAMTTLLCRRNFKQITVNDLCEKALTSRAAFYTHFKDKYDLLEYWLSCLLTELGQTDIEGVLNRLVYDDSKIIKNLMHEANAETVGILHNFMRTLLDMCLKVPEYKKNSPQYAVLSTFCIGGVYEVISWQTQKNSHPDMKMAKHTLAELLQNLIDFFSKQD